MLNRKSMFALAALNKRMWANPRTTYTKETAMLTTSKNTRLAIAILSLGLVAAGTTFADAGVRRAQVNERLANQNLRIDKERSSGTITGAQAKFLHEQDHNLRVEEKTFAKSDGGHITKPEQHLLNQQENSVSKQIK